MTQENVFVKFSSFFDLKPFGPKVRDKVMFGNARDFYRRKPPARTAR